MLMIAINGYIPDKYGLNISIFLSGSILSTAFILMTIFEELYIQMILLHTLLPIGLALNISSGDIGLKFYTHPHCRNLAVTVGTIITNLTTIVGAIIIQIMFLSGDHSWENFRFLLLYCAISTALSAILSLFLRDINYEYRTDDIIERKEEKFSYSSWDHLRGVIILKKF